VQNDAPRPTISHAARQAQQACSKLDLLHEKQPDLFGDRWQHYWSELE
jgi:hypothetical protein